MRRWFVVQLVMIGLLTGGCSPGAASPSARASAPATGPSASPTDAPSSPARAPLPSGFPVLAGAVGVAMPNDDPGLIGLWSSDAQGSAAYDFYAAALPAAGYPIIGLYPGGAAAALRFRVSDGAIWQMVARDGGNGTVAIEIRLDRP